MRFRAVVVAAAVVACAAGAAVSAAWAQHAQYYVLDAFGGVHAGDGAPAISPPTPYFGFDVAADIDYIPVGTNSAVGDGIIVLDDFGGVHSGGALASDPPVSPTPYFGFDAARAIVYRDIPTRASWAAAGPTTLTLSSFVPFLSTVLVAPDDGFLLVSASANVVCGAAPGDTTAHVTLNVDSTTLDLNLQNYIVGFSDCSDLPPGVGLLGAPVSLTRLYPVAAGSHTVNFLGRKVGGTVDPGIVGASLTAVFIDQDGTGGS